MGAPQNAWKLHTPLREAPGRGEMKGSWHCTSISNRLFSPTHMHLCTPKGSRDRGGARQFSRIL